MSKRKLFELGGIVAGIILIAFGAAALFMSVNGLGTVSDNLKQEQIYFGNAAEDEAVPAKYSEQLVDNGTKARAFAQVMRTHTLERSEGLTYSQMGRFVAASNPDDPAGTSDEAAALKDESGAPVANSARNTWVTETALTTALNLAYTAERISLFGMVVGIALLLSGIGFLVLAVGGALRHAWSPAPLAEASRPVTPIPTT
jgi:hypothetical protein